MHDKDRAANAKQPSLKELKTNNSNGLTNGNETSLRKGFIENKTIEHIHERLVLTRKGSANKEAQYEEGSGVPMKEAWHLQR